MREVVVGTSSCLMVTEKLACGRLTARFIGQFDYDDWRVLWQWVKSILIRRLRPDIWAKVEILRFKRQIQIEKLKQIHWRHSFRLLKKRPSSQPESFQRYKRIREGIFILYFKVLCRYHLVKTKTLGWMKIKLIKKSRQTRKCDYSQSTVHVKDCERS